MKILVCGASGFVGAAVCRRLKSEGHEVVRAVRRPSQAGDVAVDYARDLQRSVWLPRLRGVDAVVNAVGIIRERGTATFEALHARAPAALFEACTVAGVRRVVQISALGAADGDTPYFASKRAADEVLMAQPLAWTVLRPSLVFGLDGASTQMFCRQACLPLVPAPALPGARFQPVHIDDLTQAVLTALDPASPAQRVADVAGGAALSFDQMLAAYRRFMGLPPAPVLRIPSAAMAWLAWAGGKLPGAALTPDNWRMLRAGSALADVPGSPGMEDPGVRHGHLPRAMSEFVQPAEGECLRWRAQASWRNALMRWVLALVWIATAVVSVFIYPRADSLGLLARVGIEGWPATLALYGAAGLDAAFGLASIARPGRALWLAQGTLIAGYSIVVAVCLPEFLWHPFGPLLKNLPILAILLILYSEESTWTT